MDKNEVRQLIMNRRHELSDEDIEMQSGLIIDRLKKSDIYKTSETMVQTLYARAKETRKKNAKINDEIAVELVKKLDYDFSKADKDKVATIELEKID